LTKKIHGPVLINPLHKEKTTHVVDDIGQSNPHDGSHDAYGSDEQPRS
jgi:hypothetical protein